MAVIIEFLVIIGFIFGLLKGCENIVNKKKETPLKKKTIVTKVVKVKKPISVIKPIDTKPIDKEIFKLDQKVENLEAQLKKYEGVD